MLVAEKGEYMRNEKVLIMADTHEAQEPMRDDSEAECRRIDAFELWYWRRLLRVPWTARRSNQSILKEMNPGFLWKE